MSTPVTQTSLLYPSWWAAATLVEINFVSGLEAQFAPDVVQFFPWGLSFPDGAAGSGVAATFLPWTAVASVVKVS